MSARVHSNIPEIIRDAERKATLAVQKTAADIEAESKVRSRVDTGQMRDGWETEHQGPFESEVRNSVEHTLPNEFGTRHMGAQPMVIPAVEHAREPFKRAMAQVYG